MKFKVTIKEDKHIETELPEEVFFADTDGLPYRCEHVKWNGEFFYRRVIVNTCAGYDFEIYYMTPQEFNDYYNQKLNDGYMFSCDEEEFEKELDNARDFVNNQF